MADPTLSVTVTNFNYGRYLDQNLRSILEQSFDDFELILIDNASTDDSLEIMRSYAACDRRIRVIAHPENLGMFASLEESCAVARGRYRVHVDADDWVLSPNAFKDQVDLLDQHPTMAFAYASLAMFDSGGTEILTSRPYPHDVVLTSETALEQLLTFSLSHSGMMLRLDYYRETKGYPDAYPHVSDQLLAVRLCERGDLVGYLDRPLYAFRQHGHNLHLRPQLQVVKH
ncbi:MAG TPA: glycosyltransferase, partial [Acidimicrobiales bacterium]